MPRVPIWHAGHIILEGSCLLGGDLCPAPKAGGIVFHGGDILEEQLRSKAARVSFIAKISAHIMEGHRLPH